jgi:hypothetical protein
MQVGKILTPREFKANGFYEQEVVEPNSFSARLRRFVQLEKERRELESRIKIIEQESSVIKEQLGDELEELRAQGLDSHARMDGMTVFLKYQTWALPKDGDTQRLCEAIVESGDQELEELVHPTVDQKKLSALVKERLQDAADNDKSDDEILPPSVMEAVHITTKRYVQSRTGKSERVEE